MTTMSNKERMDVGKRSTLAIYMEEYRRACLAAARAERLAYDLAAAAKLLKDDKHWPR